MRRLWLAFVIIATLGSLYPFDFTSAGLTSQSVGNFLASCCRMSSRGDIVGNIVLFMPFGLLGMLALGPRSPGAARILALVIIGAIFALVLQLVQFFLPSRDENLQDVVWNTVGILVGGAMAIPVERLSPDSSSRGYVAATTPLVLVGVWLTYRLIPFVPSLDWQRIKDSLRPLAYEPISAVNTISDFAGWLMVGYLLRSVNSEARLDRWLPALAGATLLAEVLIVYNAVDRADVLGAVLAIGVWAIVVRRAARPESILLLVVIAAVVVAGLEPFSLRSSAAAFNWLPFHGFLHGSMFVNAQAAAEKIFFYVSIVFLLMQRSVRPGVSIAVTVSILLAIEVAQTIIGTHTPEITDPLLVLLASVAIFALDTDADGASNRVAAQQSTDGVEPLRPAGGRSDRWTAQTVNLTTSQLVTVEQEARVTDRSLSGMIRCIVDDFLAEMELVPSGSPPYPARTAGEDVSVLQDADRSNDRLPPNWVTVTVNLRCEQLQAIETLAKEKDKSVSGVIRSIVARHIEARGV